MKSITCRKGLAPSTLLVLIFLSLSVSGCSKFNCTRFEKYIGGETDLISYSYTIADDLINTAMPPLVPMHQEMPILVTTFVDNNDLNRTSKFSRVLQEHISSRLVQQGYTVKEIKMADTLLIEERSGETMLSRDLEKLSASLNTQAILVGTLSLTNRTMYISARFINPVNNNIISSTDYQLCMDDTILAMFGLKKLVPGETIEEPGQPMLNSILY